MQNLVYGELHFDWHFIIHQIYSYNSIKERLQEVNTIDSVIPKRQIFSKWLRLQPKDIEIISLIPSPLIPYDKILLDHSRLLYGDGVTLQKAEDLDKRGILILPLSFLWDVDKSDSQNDFYKIAFESLIVKIIQEIQDKSKQKVVFITPTLGVNQIMKMLSNNPFNLELYINGEIPIEELPLSKEGLYFIKNSAKVDHKVLTNFIKHIKRKL